MIHPFLSADTTDAEATELPLEMFGAVAMRPLASSDAGAFAAHLKRLGKRGRRLRFGTPVTDDFIDAYARRQLGGRALVIGLFVASTLRGVAELCFDPTDPAGAEAAFSLERRYRGLGLGARLFESVTAEARRRGIARLTLQFLRENVAMHKLAKRFGGALSFDGSEVIATIFLPTVAARRRPARPFVAPAEPLSHRAAA